MLMRSVRSGCCMRNGLPPPISAAFAYNLTYTNWQFGDNLVPCVEIREPDTPCMQEEVRPRGEPVCARRSDRQCASLTIFSRYRGMKGDDSLSLVIVADLCSATHVRSRWHHRSRHRGISNVFARRGQVLNERRHLRALLLFSRRRHDWRHVPAVVRHAHVPAENDR